MTAVEMIVAAVRSEWTKLRRPTLLWGTYGALAVIAALITVLIFAQAGHDFGRGPNLITLALLASPEGLLYAFGASAGLLGVVALCVAAAQLANEYSSGTLRNLLVRQPRRTVVLAGKYLGILSFLLGAVLVACVFGIVAAFVMAHVRGIPTTAWTSSTGLHDFGQGLGDVALSMLGYGTIGFVLGIIMRSPVSSIVVGLAFLLPFEGILSAVVNGSARWLPGSLLDAIARGGTTNASFLAALATVGPYLIGWAGLGVYLFVHRDVTS